MTQIWLVGALGLVLLIVEITRRIRAAQIERLRAEWGSAKVRDRKLEAIAASHRSRRTAESTDGLDDRTWDDLNLDAVFAALDRTESTLGQHALYHRLRSSPLGADLEAFESMVTRLGSDASARERAQLALGRLRDPQGYDLWWLANPRALERESWHMLFPVLTAATLALPVLTWVWPVLLPFLVGLFGLNVAVRYATDRYLATTALAFRQLAPVIATAEALRFLAADGRNPLLAPLATDAPNLRRLKTIARWVTGDPFMLSVSPHPMAIVTTEVANAVYEYLNLVLLLDATGVYLGATELAARGTGLLRVVAAIGDADAATSVASYRAGRSDWARPRFLDAGASAVLTDVVHPLVDDAVANTITLRPGRGVLITGSNMSGKSTFLRTVGVNAILAQTIHTCLAGRYDAPVFNVRSSIGRADDLLTGRSYYIVEVESLLALIEESADPAPHLFLLDELFRGTNSVERIAAGQAVLNELVVSKGGTKPHVVLAATHDGELVDLLPDTYAAYHFGDTIGADGLTFDHRLQPGPATTRNAIALLKLHGAPTALVESAAACAETLDRQRGGRSPRDVFAG